MSFCASMTKGALPISSASTTTRTPRGCWDVFTSFFQWDKRTSNTFSAFAGETPNASSAVQEDSLNSSPLSSFRSVGESDQKEQEPWSGVYEFTSSSRMSDLQKVEQCHTPDREDHSDRAVAATQHSHPPSRFLCPRCPNTYYKSEGLQRHLNKHELCAAISPESQGLPIQEAFELRMTTDSGWQEIDTLSQPIPALGQHPCDLHAVRPATITRSTSGRSSVRDVGPGVPVVTRTWKCCCPDTKEYRDPALLHYHQERCKSTLARPNPSNFVLRGKCSVSTSLAESLVNSTNPGSENLDEQPKQSSTAPSETYPNRLPHRFVQAVEEADHLRKKDMTLSPGSLSLRRWDIPSKYSPLNYTPRD